MSFGPHGSYYVGDTLHAPDSPDSLYPRRATLIVFGLAATVVAFGECLLALRHVRRRIAAMAPSLATFFACAVIGWRSYPYWAMGVYQVGIGSYPQRDQDPKALIPMTWIGEFWRLPVMFLYLICYLALPALAVQTIILLKRRQFFAAGVTAGCTSIALIFMLACSPDYMAWLMD